DFDRVLVDWLLEDIRTTQGVDLAGDAESRQELRLAAEAAKCRLSFEARTQLAIPFGDFVYRRDITREELEARLGSLVERTLGPCRLALRDAGLSPAHGDEGVVGGGGTTGALV